ncbi:LysM peptidoglycan-binding domain-containing protein [Acinetobacter pragensis]|uniref:Peptidoglycan-binding protein n=1 Tax=Acinetobacter pragensis TaxID=1806892 RepID=A0A151XZD5_9GAMM|nr:LysM peptidoglycan-binding domain-containing protein [Acinetobacter pragensis]KYQ71183.1 peptidoglycan-binding protein [Acinetobacter pragensis]
MSNKALVTVQILDALGNPIPKIHYQVKNQKTDQHVVKGITNSKGCFYEIQRDKGTVLDVYVKGLFDNGLTKVKSFTISKDRMLVKVLSPKLLIDLKTLENNGKQGGYTRKPHIVQKGDTLTSIAQQYDSTVRALESLNTLKNINKLSVGQVIKLPFYTPATGNNISQDRKPQPLKKQIESTKSKKNTPKKDDEKKAGQSLESSLGDYKNKALEQLNEWYEDGKKALSEAVKIEMKEDRSKDSGTPKSDVLNLCMSSPQCITSGQSELIREINIRLAGFGGALPTDKFTPLTEACIKQFQRDYMGAPETGKICGGLLVSLDKFRDEYGISKFMEAFKCPCGKCNGFGKARSGTFTFESFQEKTKKYTKVQKTLTEPKGMHRSLIWGLKAMEFYFSKKENDRGYKISRISSGYRCVDNNLINRRATVNHLGTAIDIVISDKYNKKIDKNELESHVRKEWFCKYLNATMGWAPNQFGLETLSHGADKWVHLDIREFADEFKADKLFSSNKDILNGDYLINISKKNTEYSGVLGCAGLVAFPASPDLNDSSLEDLIKKLGSAISHGEGNYESYNTGTIKKKVIHSFLNPAKGTITGKTVNQIIQSYSLSPNETSRMFAVGKYQVTPDPMREAKLKLGLSGNEKFDESLQEKIFREYLIPSKRPKLGDFVLKGVGNSKDAQYEAAKEWASIATPQGYKVGKSCGGYVSDGNKSYYESSANHANKNSTKMVKAILEKISQYHQQNKK